MNFNRALDFGKAGEQLIFRFLIARGNYALPVYELETDNRDKGPRIFGPGRHELIGPDGLFFSRNGMKWAEAKRKTCFSWHRKSLAWTTGIDLRCFRDYLEIRRRFGFEVWLFFLHQNACPSAADLRMGSPPACPTGLFCGEIERLERCANHTSDRHGPSGMIYWRDDSLKRIASLAEITETALRRGPIPEGWAETAVTRTEGAG